jgi:FkbM family methyltransferase
LRPGGRVGDGLASVMVDVGGTSFAVIDTAHLRYGDFWGPFAAGIIEPETVATICRHAGPGRLFVDVGAWIGPFALLAAALGCDVVAFEPDPVAAAMLRRNVALNPALAPRIDVREQALGARTGRVLLESSVGLGNARSRLVGLVEHSNRFDAEPLSVVEVEVGDAGAELGTLLKYRQGTILKIDVEGGEFQIVPALHSVMAVHRPVLLLSIHQPDSSGRLRSIPRRVARSRRMGGVVRALRPYRSLSRGHSHRVIGRTPLTRWKRVMTMFRLGEFELFADD